MRHPLPSLLIIISLVAASLIGCASNDSDTDPSTTEATPTTNAATPVAEEPEASTTTTTTAATTTTGAPAPLDAKYQVVATSGLSGEDTQEITVWAPDAEGAWPVVYGLHGTGGNAQGLAELATALAGQGAVVFATD